MDARNEWLIELSYQAPAQRGESQEPYFVECALVFRVISVQRGVNVDLQEKEASKRSQKASLHTDNKATLNDLRRNVKRRQRDAKWP